MTGGYLKHRVGLALAISLAGAAVLAKDYDVRAFGAKGDGKADDTASIQKAIDACSAAGGGRVVVEGGTFWIKPIMIKDGVDLHLDRTATLFASGDWRDYPGRGTLKTVESEDMPRGRDSALITADSAHGVALTGDGVINGNSEPFVEPDPEAGNNRWKFRRIGRNKLSPPRVVLFVSCTDVRVEDVTITNQPSNWAYMIHDCDRVNISRAKVLSNIHYPNNDGIHINSSRDVTVSDCTVVAGDDAIVIRAMNRSFRDRKPRTCERVAVVNCQLRGYSDGIRLGWCRDGLIRDCTISNCTITDSCRGINIWAKDAPESFERGEDVGIERTRIKNVIFSNIVLDRIHTYPISVVVGDPSVSHCEAIRNLTFANLVSRAYGMPEFVGTKECPLENFLFTGCRFIRSDAPDVRPPWAPENEPYGRGKSESVRRKGFLWGYGGDHADSSNPLHNCKGFTFNACTFDNELSAVPERKPPDIDWTLGLEGGDPAKGPWTTNFFSVANQALVVRKTGADTWSFACDRLVNSRLRVNVGVTLEVACVGGKTTVSGRIVNNEPGTRVFSFDGPFTAERYTVVDGKTNFLFPWSNGTLVRKFPTVDEENDGFGCFFARREDGLWVQDDSKRLEYPSRRCMMQWMTATDGDRGLYLAVKDAQFRAKHVRLEFDAVKRTLRFGFEHRLYAHCGETYELPPTEFVRYGGDWHVAARDYGAWFAKARPYAHVPDKVKDCSTLMLLLCKQQNGEIVWPYKDFDKLGDAALRYGIRHIKILARGPGGHDNLYPDYYPDPAQGGTNALMKGLAELKKRGIETYAYVNGQLIECGTTEYWRRGGGSAAGVLQRNGRRAQELWLKYTDKTAHVFDVACPWDRTWLDKMMAVTKEAQYLGFDGMYFDQVAKQWPWQCWATNHGHRPGDWVWTEDRARYLKGIHDELVKLDSDFILTSEGYNETVSDSCSIHLGLGDCSTIRQRFDADAAFYKFPEMAFYAIPRLRTSDRYPSPHRGRDDVNETAIAGYAVDIEVRYPCERRLFESCENVTKEDYGTVCSPPIEFEPLDTVDLKTDRDYLKAVNDFRYANREILLRGRYDDTVGFTVDTTAAKWMAKRWTASDGKSFGVLVWNAGAEPANFIVKADGCLVNASEPEKGVVLAETAVPANTLRLWRFASN